jgi:hypothetical protein
VFASQSNNSTTTNSEVSIKELMMDTHHGAHPKKSLKIPKGQSKSVYRRRTDNTMAKRKSINRYKISASQRTKNMFHLSWPQSSSSFFVYDLSPSGAPEFTPLLSGVRVTRSLVLYVCFVDRFLIVS